MPKHSNNRPWPQNLLYDFCLSAISSSDVEVFIDSLPTTERNKSFLLLRYREGKTYKEIATAHDMTPAGVRLAIIAMQEKFRGEAASAATPSPAATTPPPAVTTPPPAVSTPHPADTNATKESSRPLSINLAAIRRFLGLTVANYGLKSQPSRLFKATVTEK